MPKRVVLETIHLSRKDDEGVFKRVTPPIGKVFNFTKSEVADIEEVRPNRALRMPTQDEAAAAGHEIDEEEIGDAPEPVAPKKKGADAKKPDPKDDDDL